MFNNIKYKIKDEVINPIIQSKTEQNVTEIDNQIVDDPYKNIKDIISFYKPMSFLSKMYHLPMLLKTIYTNLKKIYNDN